MKRLFKALLTFVLLVVLVNSLKAQHPVSLYYLENIPQSSNINPAMAPRANAFVGLPVINSFYIGLRTDLFGPNFIQEAGKQGYLLTHRQFDHDKLYRGIGKAANFGTSGYFAPIFFGFSGKKGYFTFGITDKYSVAFNMPKSFFQMIENGFENGGTLDFSPLGFNASYYREFMAGYSYQLTSQIRVGAHVKLLQGLFAVKSDIEKFDLYTSQNRWSVDMRGGVYASAPMNVTLDDQGVPETVEMDSMGVSDYIDYGLLNFSNPGFAFDIGAVYEFSPAWTFSASLNDIGFIRWGGNLNSFTANGRYDFTGIKADKTDLDSMDVIIDEMVDSLENVLQYRHGKEGFSSGLGPQLYLGAQYNVNHYLSLGALSRTVFKKYDFQQEFNVSANLNLYNVLTTTLNYTVALSGANSVGFGLGLRGGPVQFYMLMDYLPTSFRNYIIETEEEQEDGTTKITQSDPILGPVSFESFNIMLGLNVIIGANGYKDSPMIDAYSEF